MLPLVILQGPAKSGKDTVANFLVEDGEFIAIAMADPMKRLGQLLFGFTDEQLWGESRELKEAVDLRFIMPPGVETPPTIWAQAAVALHSKDVASWISTVLPETQGDRGLFDSAFQALLKWFRALPRPELSPRVMLQTLGTEWGRNFCVDMWSDLAIKTAQDLLKTPNLGYNRSRGTYLSKIALPTPAGVVITDGRFRSEIINVKQIGGLAVRIDNPSQQEPSSVGVAGHSSETEMFSIPQHFFDLILVNNKKDGLPALREKVQAFISNFKFVTVYP